MADLLISEGYAEVGYKMISLDDCWLAKSRNSQGKLQPDPTRFPSGIAALSSYVNFLSSKFILRLLLVTATGPQPWPEIWHL